MMGFRFYNQAIETFVNNESYPGCTVDAFNKRVNKSGICPTITTRPDGFKTAIVVVVKNHGDCGRKNEKSQ